MREVPGVEKEPKKGMSFHTMRKALPYVSLPFASTVATKAQGAQGAHGVKTMSALSTCVTSVTTIELPSLRSRLVAATANANTRMT
ncbi:hypothetical protein G5I_10905 [Acromyrmex echinatior]|uniref:Uncharacterized protein n=1 Tax=Acromyrmex echinatior TaxID=103372 RepID=F4WYC1_ACREC|nr:hypothetical protein G5I_10905 [Acromyrmex echinatior]